MPDTAEHDALVTATYRRRMDVRLADRQTVTARVKGRQLRPVCGDRVRARHLRNEPEWLITEILPRDNVLTRPDARGRQETLAANLTFLAVVAADPPKPDWFVVDRYLSAAESMTVAAAVVFNKIDIANPGSPVIAELDEYDRIGYSTLLCSAETGANVEQLGALLAGQVAIIVGQSGVGKSSLINRLVEDADQRVDEVSSASGEGRHTTVNSIMLDLPGGGGVIDSPGVRDYAPAMSSADEVIAGFREIAVAGQDCRFANCRHLREPGCAVKRKVESGGISARRYESYKRLQSLTGRLTEDRF